MNRSPSSEILQPKAAPPIEDDASLPLPDEAVIQAFIRGDMDGFKYVYATYRQRVMSYCVYYMGSQTQAEDAFQEVFTRVYTHREQLREPKALKSWVLLITRSVCLNMLRTSKFTPDFVSIDQRRDEGFEDSEFLGLSISPSEHLGSGDVLQEALQRLAPMYREAFMLREFEGYDYEEIAKITSTSVMNVKVRITRAKKRLRILLAPYYTKQESTKRRKTTAKVSQDNAFDTNDVTGDDNDMDTDSLSGHSEEEAYV